MRFAPPGDPLVVGMNKMLVPDGSEPRDYSLTVPILSKYVPKVRRSGKELPADGQTQTVINAVLVYKLLGMTANEMSHCLGTTIEQIEHVMNLPAFQETFELLFSEILSVNSGSLQARIASYAGNAAEKVMELSSYRPQPKVRKDEEGNEVTEEGDWKVPPIVVLKASQDILDRTGLSADTLFGKGNQDTGNTLQIEVISEQDSKTQVNIKMGK